jgi:putative endonuclease
MSLLDLVLPGRVDPKRLGRLGESRAALYYRLRFYRVLARNVRDGDGEIDLVVKRGATVAFVEVKSRQQTRAGSPEEAVGREKQLKVARLAERFCRERRLGDCRIRFDVVAVYWTGRRFRLQAHLDAFTLQSRPGVPWVPE